ncbi:dihydrolipoamide acetyltransferase family protein [Flavobacterium sangjuense]|uniref:Dihydrolipoamide acetyltransferase component of pyruvate dehydrogenase complex n=1 Tax=Flavobacterium sangjuense TaxID=2518177 RepID=A0A4P7PTC1_9FLAO|nr:dihydrolipoamide acetyltransferase family protein [Flavobacterium sangjuense]QBZ98129.1 Dihydrolipoyllysine-residue acetyltransferase component of pyruvate dehydrogenase complex [Flavobacterium sangjuense]
MAKFELKLPKMGESVAEATITNWLKNVGEKIDADEAVLEIATDKVDSEVPSEVSGTLTEILFQVNDVVKVGQTIAIIETEGGSAAPAPEVKVEEAPAAVVEIAKTVEAAKEAVAPADFKSSDKFYSPLVKNIATAEGISVAELESIAGSGKDGRVTKEDILNYIKNRGSQPAVAAQPVSAPATPSVQAVPVSVNGGDEIVEMDRMRKLISGYMVASVQTSAHVQSFIEVDVTNIVKWRDRVKNAFEKREGEKLTFTPIFMEAVAKALKDFPGMNISVDGEFIIKRKNINLGMAAALPNGNLIVPVIKNADQLNLVGMAKAVNDLGNRAKAGKLKPDDTQGGTYTVTNVGTFGSVFGTPIINQPQVGILALGAIRKVPAVIETPEGDFIGIRQKMFLSHSYDHRVVDGALGGSFVKRVAEYLEAFDANREY